MKIKSVYISLENADNKNSPVENFQMWVYSCTLSEDHEDVVNW